MNRVSLSGTLLGRPIPFGEALSGLRFLLRVPYKFHRDGQSKEANTVVPCMIFKCPAELKALLLGNEKGIWIEAEGRINRSSYEPCDGERRFNTEVILNPLTAFVYKR